MSNRPVHRKPGYDVDRIDVATGLRELKECGYDDAHTRCHIYPPSGAYWDIDYRVAATCLWCAR